MIVEIGAVEVDFEKYCDEKPKDDYKEETVSGHDEAVGTVIVEGNWAYRVIEIA